jgi:hypothetical protein
LSASISFGNPLGLVVVAAVIDKPMADGVQLDARSTTSEPFEKSTESGILVREIYVLLFTLGAEDAVGETDPVEFAREQQHFGSPHVVKRKLEAGRSAVDRQNIRHVRPTPRRGEIPLADVPDVDIELVASASVRYAVQASKIHDRCKADRIKAGAAYQESVDFGLRYETLRHAVRLPRQLAHRIGHPSPSLRCLS